MLGILHIHLTNAKFNKYSIIFYVNRKVFVVNCLLLVACPRNHAQGVRRRTCRADLFSVCPAVLSCRSLDEGRRFSVGGSFVGGGSFNEDGWVVGCLHYSHFPLPHLFGFGDDGIEFQVVEF